jgi:hypothetical protein
MGTDAAAFVRAGIQSAISGYDVEVLVAAPAGVVREKIGRWSAVSAVGTDRCLVRITADSLDWPVMALGMIGADFQVISPPELLDRLHDWGRRFGRASRIGLAALFRPEQVREELRFGSLTAARALLASAPAPQFPQDIETSRLDSQPISFLTGELPIGWAQVLVLRCSPGEGPSAGDARHRPALGHSDLL